MLILTRRVGETLMIGDDVTVTVLGVKGNQVRIGINAPKEISVHREEIYERIKREQETQSGDAQPVEQSLNGLYQKPDQRYPTHLIEPPHLTAAVLVTDSAQGMASWVKTNPEKWPSG